MNFDRKIKTILENYDYDNDVEAFYDLQDEIEKWMIYYCWVVNDPEFATVERLHDAAAEEFELDTSEDEVSSELWDLAGKVTAKKPRPPKLKKVTKYIEKAGYDFT
jgi:hypothetical protein